MRPPITRKQAMALYWFATGCSIKEIAKDLGVSRGTIHSRLSAIKKKLPEEFERVMSLRNTHKRAKENLENPSEYNDDLQYLERY